MGSSAWDSEAAAHALMAVISSSRNLPCLCGHDGHYSFCRQVHSAWLCAQLRGDLAGILLMPECYYEAK